MEDGIEESQKSAPSSLHLISLDRLSDELTRRKVTHYMMGALGGIVVGALPLAEWFNPTNVDAGGSIRSAEIDKRQNSYSELAPLRIERGQFQLIGVAHTPDTFNSYHRQISTKVKSSGKVVFLEYFDDEIIRRAEAKDRQVIEGDRNSNSEVFFASVARVCADEGKDIVVVNPQTYFSQLLDFQGIYGVTGALAYRDFKQLGDRLLKEKVSRRNFLKLPFSLGARALAYGTVMPRLAANATEVDMARNFRGVLQQLGILKSDMSEDEQAHVMSFLMEDWRDVCSASGIEATFKKYEGELDKGVVPMFQGYWHNGMIEYLKNPKLRANKEVVYKSNYNLTGDRSVRRFSFRKGKWEKVDQFGY